MKKKLYQVWEENQMVFEGTCEDLEKKYNFSRESIYRYAHVRKALIDGRYRVVDTDTYIEITAKKVTEIKKKEDPIERIVWHLKMYGNTLMMKEETKYLPTLKEMGFNCISRKVFDDEDINIDLNEGKTKKRRNKERNYYYILEVIR